MPKKLILDPPVDWSKVVPRYFGEDLIVTYDIETAPMISAHFQLGKQILRHGGLLGGYFSRTHIMSISYKYMHEKEIRRLTWGNSIEDEINMVKEFSKVIKSADVIIGKNNSRFDDKHITTNMMFFGLDDYSLWSRLTEDLESQMRRHFKLGSYTLDYLSDKLGLGGKNKMEWSDWQAMMRYRYVQILNHIPKSAMNDVLLFNFGEDYKTIVHEGKAASEKMFTYGDKDVADTEKLWNYCIKYCNPKTALKAHNPLVRVCYKCGSADIIQDKYLNRGELVSFYCKHHKGYAGRARVLKSGGLGKTIK